jgi:hypothetical protein
MSQSLPRWRWVLLTVLCLVGLATPPLVTIVFSRSTHEAQQDSPAMDQNLDPAMVAAVTTANQNKTFQCTSIVGGAFASIPFQDICPDGVLIGFRLGYGKFVNDRTISFVQPIYMTASGETLGQGFGKRPPEPLEVKAPPGYAVGSAIIGGGGNLDSLTLTFMHITGDRLDLNDARVTEKLGGTGMSVTSLGGDGIPAIGISGRVNEDGKALGLGVVFLSSTSSAKP